MTLRAIGTNPFSTHLEPEEPLFTITPGGSADGRVTVAGWTALDQFIVTGHENGKLNLWDMEGELFYEKEDKAHSATITDLQMSADGTYFLTSSKDKSAKVCLYYLYFWK